MTEGSSQTNNARSPPRQSSAKYPGPLHPSIPSVSADTTASATRLQLPRARRPSPRLAQRSPPPPARRSAPRYSATPSSTGSFRRGIYSRPQTTPATHPALPSPPLLSGTPGTYPRRRRPPPPGQDEAARGPDGGGCWGCGGRRAGAAASPPPAPPPSSADAPAPVAEPALWRAATVRPRPRSGPPRGPPAVSPGARDSGTAERGREEVSHTPRKDVTTPSSPGIGGVSEQKKYSPPLGD